MVRAIELGFRVRLQGRRSQNVVKPVRKVAAGNDFISPRLAEAVTFSGASMKANPMSQMTAASWKSYDYWAGAKRSSQSPICWRFPTRPWPTLRPCSSRSSAPKAIRT